MTAFSKQQVRRMIAWRIAREFNDGDVVNLGIGLPTLVANEVPEDIEIFLQAENGLLGIGEMPGEAEINPDLVNAGGQPITAITGACTFDSATSFGIIRGGHVNVSVLGALQVDEQGNLANWIIPGKMVPGMGGAMDLVVGAKKVIVATEHTNRGVPKLLKRCSLPLTAVGEVNMVVTEMGVFELTGQGFCLTEYAPGCSIEAIRAATEASLHISPQLKPMPLPQDL
jgi:acetate CoA/acetoacetate CoA-transferase beta subunit